MEHFKTEIKDGVQIVWIDRSDKAQNSFSDVVLKELSHLLDKISQNRDLTGLVFISKKNDHYIYGLDIDELSKLGSTKEAEEGAAEMQNVLAKISALPIPSVAGISGMCLGGGLEMALACTWRLISSDNNSKIGLPEIKLGLIPGAGGTQRLPRLIGLEKSLDLILTGKMLDPKRALKAGVIDDIVPHDRMLEIALGYAVKKRRGENSQKKEGTSNYLKKLALEKNSVGRNIFKSGAKQRTLKATKGFYPAAMKAIEVIFAGYEKKSLSDGLALEARAFGELWATKESHSLVHLYHATTHCKKNPYIDDKKDLKGISSLGVYGGGLMGSGIACVSVDKDIPTFVSDPNPDSISKSYLYAKKYFDKKLERRRIKPFEHEAKMIKYQAATEPLGFENCDMVIEAVFENLALKRKILSDLEKKEKSQSKSKTIFASNTSALPIKEIAAEAKDKSRVVGLHFFSPVEKMPLLEIIKTKETSKEVLSRCFEYGKRINKQVIVVEDGPGFYTTRVLAFFLNEAVHLLEEGVKVEEIDKALTEFGFPVGPVTLIDEVGIDVGGHVIDTIEKSFPDRMKKPSSFDAILADKRLGRKNERGFYKYESGKKTSVDTDVYKFFPTDSKSNITRGEIVDRCLYMMINEAYRCLDEGILAHKYDGDVGAVFGLGFPPFLGGPFHYSETHGLDSVKLRLEELASRFGDRFKPAKGISSKV